MKKLLISVFLFALPLSAMGATYNCQVQSLGDLRIKNSNEYLYLNSADFNSKRALVCGHQGTDGCGEGVTVFVTGQHWYGTKSIGDARLYRCSTTGGNVWYDIGTGGLTQCQNVTGLRKVSVFNDKGIYLKGNYTNRYAASSYYLGNTLCWAYDTDGGENFENKPKDDEAVTEKPSKPKQPVNNDATRCANSGGTWSANKVCVCDANKNLVTSGGVCVCKSGTNWINSKNKKLGCKVLTTTETDAIKKACETEKAKASGATWDSVAKACKCENHKDGYKQTFDEKEGICKLDDKVAICLGIEGATWSVLQDECVCKDETLKPNDRTKKCEKTQAAIAAEEEAALIQKIRSAYTKLQGLESGLGKATVWKTADGKFNTSRLVSDSVAGVVLGTTGALVTSHLVKKKQVEDGFEDIQCVVGGQVVADWGDSFNVGIKN